MEAWPLRFLLVLLLVLPVQLGTQVLGPFAGNLQDSGERLGLERPDTPGTDGVPYIVVDEVRYNDKPPWPVSADGEGPSLQRLAPGPS